MSIVVSAVALFAASTSTARAADECIVKPNAEPPHGQHWYYRTEPETKRQCWYLAAQGAGMRKTATETLKQVQTDGVAVLSPQQREALFRKYIEWQQTHPAQHEQ